MGQFCLFHVKAAFDGSLCANGSSKQFQVLLLVLGVSAGRDANGMNDLADARRSVSWILTAVQHATCKSHGGEVSDRRTQVRDHVSNLKERLVSPRAS